jgi:hypothetical protein
MDYKPSAVAAAAAVAATAAAMECRQLADLLVAQAICCRSHLRVSMVHCWQQLQVSACCALLQQMQGVGAIVELLC